MCSLGLEDVMIPLCWWVWRHPQRGEEIRREFSILADIKKSSQSDDERFFDYMLKVGGDGLPFMVKIVVYAIEKAWVALSQGTH